MLIDQTVQGILYFIFSFLMVVLVTTLSILLVFIPALLIKACWRELRKPVPVKCLHNEMQVLWEVVTLPEKCEGWRFDKNGMERLLVLTKWRERCSACGELRDREERGVWSLEELTGEKTYGVVRS